ncbi:hypothetical protein [Rhodobacter lacus]|uniref:Dihydroorotate dehydrogenase n=1 Tax=Rhodobacter lacus TaxID=1641972 RepID=A0ABW5A7M8_9RHOB
MTEMNDEDDIRLEDFLSSARRAAPDPAPALLAQMALQAEVILAERQAAEAAARDAARAAQAPRPRGLMATLAGALGGWSTLGGMAGGMATATVAGLWIGMAQAPSWLPTTAAMGTGATVVATTAADDGQSYLNDADILALAQVD